MSGWKKVVCCWLHYVNSTIKLIVIDPDHELLEEICVIFCELECVSKNGPWFSEENVASSDVDPVPIAALYRLVLWDSS